MSYEEHTWIYDVSRTAAKEGERSCYHAFLPPNTTSVCGKMTTEHFGTKIPGAPDCEACLAITGPEPESDGPEGDLVAFHALPRDAEVVTVVAQPPETSFDFERALGDLAARWEERYGPA